MPNKIAERKVERQRMGNVGVEQRLELRQAGNQIVNHCLRLMQHWSVGLRRRRLRPLSQIGCLFPQPPRNVLANFAQFRTAWDE